MSATIALGGAVLLLGVLLLASQMFYTFGEAEGHGPLSPTLNDE